MTKRVNTIIKRLNEYFDDIVRVEEVPKNNGVVLHGVMFKDKVGVSPVVYVENFTEFTPKRASIRIIRALRDALESAPSLENLNFKDYDKFKDSIMLGVLNEEANADNLCNVPFRKHEDLAVFIFTDIAFGDGNKGIVRINDNILKLWGVPFEEAYEQAYKNTIRDVRFLSMFDFIKGEKKFANLSIEGVTADSFPIVITNEAQMYGASAIVLDEVLDKLAEIAGEDLVIVPSSIHELIIDVLSHKECYEDAVSIINASTVRDDEVLSNHVYTHTGNSK